MFWASGSIPHPPLLPSSPAPRFAPPVSKNHEANHLFSKLCAKIEIFSRCIIRSKSIFGEVSSGGSIRGSCLEGCSKDSFRWTTKITAIFFLFRPRIFRFLGGGMDWLERMKSVTVTISSKQFYSGRVTHERRTHEGDM